MRTSQYLLATVKEVPADAEIISHQLMLRAGMIRKLASGLYTWLPLGLRVLRRVERIVREEMDRAGALELLMPAIQPAELWQETDRWDKFGPQLLKIVDRHERNFCFGPTHEEVITDLMRRELRSYKQLPICFYQIQNKFRDEIRPRFGIMRAREFLMKDAYSFHMDMDSLQETYEKMYQAYSTIFTRLGLKFRAVLADTGSIGGSGSHEFHVLAESGEDQIFYSDVSSYAANVELAEALADTDHPDAVHQTTQTILVKGTQHPIVALVLRSDHELNSIKAEKHPLIFSPLTPIKSDKGEKESSIPKIIDRGAAGLGDFSGHDIADLRKVQVGDKSPDGQGTLQMARGIEVGHIFQLGTKYSEAMQATVLDEQGKTVAMPMGCYGIGVSRIVAAAIEQNYDERGIVWPANMAPFQVALIGIQAHQSDRLQFACETLYASLCQEFEVLYDDRRERPGVMFADMDLIGIPHRLVMSERGLEAGTVEYRARSASKSIDINLEEVIEFLKIETSYKV